MEISVLGSDFGHVTAAEPSWTPADAPFYPSAARVLFLFPYILCHEKRPWFSDNFQIAPDHDVVLDSGRASPSPTCFTKPLALTLTKTVLLPCIISELPLPRHVVLDSSQAWSSRTCFTRPFSLTYTKTVLHLSIISELPLPQRLSLSLSLSLLVQNEKENESASTLYLQGNPPRSTSRIRLPSPKELPVTSSPIEDDDGIALLVALGLHLPFGSRYSMIHLLRLGSVYSSCLLKNSGIFLVFLCFMLLN